MPMLIPVAALLLLGMPASALATAGAPSAGQDCTAQALPAGSAAAPVVTCYATFAQSIRAATSGRVNLPARTAARSVSLTELNAGPATPAATYVLSIDWTGTGYSGNSLTWYQSSKCGNFQASSMPSGWNDVVSSAATYSGCVNTLYQNINFGGSTLTVRKDTADKTLGSFNRQTSSEKWCTASRC
jgi:hypothetical protein